MCKHHVLHGFLPDHNLDEPDYDRFETEPDPDAPRPTTMDDNRGLTDELWIIGTGKTRAEWGYKK